MGFQANLLPAYFECLEIFGLYGLIYLIWLGFAPKKGMRFSSNKVHLKVLFEANIKHRHHFAALDQRLLADIYLPFGINYHLMDDGPDHAKFKVIRRFILIDIGH